jgi:hypothetical protein
MWQLTELSTRCSVFTNNHTRKSKRVSSGISVNGTWHLGKWGKQSPFLNWFYCWKVKQWNPVKTSWSWHFLKILSFQSGWPDAFLKKSPKMYTNRFFSENDYISVTVEKVAQLHNWATSVIFTKTTQGNGATSIWSTDDWSTDNWSTDDW